MKEVIEKMADELFKGQNNNMGYSTCLMKAEAILALRYSNGEPMIKVNETVWLDKPDSEGWWWFIGQHRSSIMNKPEPILVHKERFGFKASNFFDINEYQGKWAKAILPKES